MVASTTAAVATAVVIHAVWLFRLLRRALPSRFRMTVRFYVAAACLAQDASRAVGALGAAHSLSTERALA